MEGTVLKSSQPRHIALVERLTDVADEVFAVLECNTVFPGQVADFFGMSETMQQYFAAVTAAEVRYFGSGRFLGSGVHVLPIKAGDLNRLPQPVLSAALDSDAFVVFGSSCIKRWLIDTLVQRQALNIHMGVSPYYRGSSCNFWAMNDGNQPWLARPFMH